MRAGTRFSQLLNLRVFQQYPSIRAIQSLATDDRNGSTMNQRSSSQQLRL